MKIAAIKTKYTLELYCNTALEQLRMSWLLQDPHWKNHGQVYHLLVVIAALIEIFLSHTDALTPAKKWVEYFFHLNILLIGLFQIKAV